MWTTSKINWTSFGKEILSSITTIYQHRAIHRGSRSARESVFLNNNNNNNNNNKLDKSMDPHDFVCENNQKILNIKKY